MNYSPRCVSQEETLSPLRIRDTVESELASADLSGIENNHNLTNHQSHNKR